MDNKGNKSTNVEKALEYAEASNGIEDVNLNSEGMKIIKEALLSNRGDDSFFYNLVEMLRNGYDGEEEKIRGKNK